MLLGFWPPTKAIAGLALAAALVPAASSSAQSSPQDYLRRQAAALKAQMIRVETEQAAAPGFAAQAYAAQQRYLQDTVEKSFRIGKPATVSNAQRVRRESEQQFAAPVHAIPHPAAAAPSPPPSGRQSRSGYVANNAGYRNAPRRNSPAPAPRNLENHTPRAYPEPVAASGRQDQISALVSQSKYASAQGTVLPTTQFASDVAVTTQNPNAAQPTRRQKPQPFFQPEARATTRQLAERPRAAQPNGDAHRAAYQRMATAIDQREHAIGSQLAVADDFEISVPEVSQVSLSESVTKGSQQAAGSGTRLPRRATAKQLRQVPAKQVSVLNTGSSAAPQEPDDNLNRFNSPPLRPEEDIAGQREAPSNERRKIEELENKIRELESDRQGSGTRQQASDLDSLDLNDGLRDDDFDLVRESENDDRLGRKSCPDFRNTLLNRSIRDISLDISPGASRIRDQFVAISRSWTDRLGNIVATGSMVDLRRGYLIIDGINGRVKVPYAKLSDADLAAVSDYWQIPNICSIGDDRLPSRNWVPQSFTWTASALCHKPLYFENQQLERYGHSHGPVLQPIHSAAHFFVSLATLPYATAIHPPQECRYALGYYRPGNCAPWLKDPVPISLDGIRRQALITTGLAFIP